VEAAGSSRRPRVAVIDYGMGNLRSVNRAMVAAGADAYLAASPQAAEGADAVVFPGQGAMADCMACIRRNDFEGFIQEWIAADRPFLGVCMGLQVLFERSEEADVPGLGVFPGVVTRFPSQPGLRIPHMGWNEAIFKESSALTAGLAVGCETDYAGRFISGIRRGRVLATQFHPEKSQVKGLQLYRNFLTLIDR
jgi:glutamine amidotransferase